MDGVKAYTKIRQAIEKYHQSFEAYNEPWNDCVNALLDETRRVMNLDGVCILMGEAFDRVYSIQYASVNEKANFLWDFTHKAENGDVVKIARSHYGKDLVTTYIGNAKGIKSSIMSYGFFTDKTYEGALLLVDIENPSREWSLDEHKAIVLLGRCLHQFVQNTRNELISKELTKQRAKLRKTLQNVDLINALCSQYSDVFQVSLDKNAYKVLRLQGKNASELDPFEVELITSTDELVSYVCEHMSEAESKRFLDIVDFENVKISLWDKDEFVECFQCEYGGRKQYVELKVVGLGEAPYSSVVMGFVDVTETVIADEENEKNRQIVDALSDDYIAVFYVDAATHMMEMLRATDEYFVENYGAYFTKGVKYDDVVRVYTSKDTNVDEDDELYKYCDFDYILSELEKLKVLAISYRRNANGVERQYRMKAVRVLEKNKIVGVVLGFADIEDEYRSDLAYQDQLNSALREAKSASASKTNFLFNMSHDIRTPMNAILGFSTLAKKEINNPEKIEDYLGKIESAGKHLLELINDVLDMARIENGKVELNPVSIDVREHFNSTVEMFKIDMEKKGIEFNASINVEHPFILADTLRFKQIDLNLLGNALKYTKTGGKVWYKVKELPCDMKDRVLYEIVIQDTGIGMSEEFQKNVFKLFEREKRDSIIEEQGTGLGLAITKRLVDMMGGTITCHSVLNKGTEFKCLLYFDKAKENKIEEETTSVDVSKLEGKRILLVEDNDINREIATMILEEVGIIVEEAVDGTYAVDMMNCADSDYYDLILMDIQMPYMDGYKATRIIRSAEKNSGEHIPIVAMTANAFDEDKKKAFESGMDAHLAKPVNTNELYKELVRLIR